jgi:hypothetical protein
VKRGRPRAEKPVIVLQIKLRLYPGVDDDLLSFFGSVPPLLRAAMVKRALRSGMPASGEQEAAGDSLLDALDSFVN